MRMNAKGSILIVALWAMIFFVMAAATLGARARSQISVVKRLSDGATARAAAYSGIGYVAGLIAESDEPDPEERLVYWRSDSKRFEDVSLFPSAQTHLSIGYPEDGVFINGLDDEESRVNINTASVDVFTRLYASTAGSSLEAPEKLAAATIEWRQKNAASSWPGFVSVEELTLVPGMSAERWELLKPHLTVWGKGHVNLNTVSVKTLIALGVSEALAERIVDYRLRQAMEAQKTTSAAAPAFNDLGDLTQKVHVTPEEDTELQNISGLWGFDSDAFHFFTFALRGQKREGGFECVINREGTVLALGDAREKFQLSSGGS